MRTNHTITLGGCAPAPLSHYLKALGILRIVSEQKSRSARAHWQRDQFLLLSDLDRKALTTFLLDEYKPTPILSPWNAGSGFYYQEEKLNKRDPATGHKVKTGVRNQETTATRVVSEILTSSNPRLSAYRQVIYQTKLLLDSKGLLSAPDTSGADKGELLIELRSIWPDAAVEWLDCVAVLASSHDALSRTGLKPWYTTLLGSGANDGNADFTSNFMQRLTEIFAAPREQALKWLNTSVFGENNAQSTIQGLAGQFSPGTAGGVNSTSGFTSKYSINPWDYVLLIEGTLLFSAAAVRQHESSSDGTIAYPFCVTSCGVGYASAALADERTKKSITEEMWLPLWTRPSSNEELRAVFGEGRAQIRGQSVKTGVDFAQAVCTLGTDVGIDSFQRVGFLARNGESIFAIPLGRIHAERNAGVHLLADIESWLRGYRRAATNGKSKGPASVRRALTRLESAIIHLCVSNTPERLMAVFIALGQCEKAASRSLKWSKENFVAPLQGLRKAWLTQNWTQSVELRLAASLASIDGKCGNDWRPFRCHLEPVTSWYDKDRGRTGYRWSEVVTNDVRWIDGPLPDVLNDVLTRRLILAGDTPKQSGLWASLSDIKIFIEGGTNDALLSDLLWSMSLVDWRDPSNLPPGPMEREPVPPTCYAMLKLCFPLRSKPLPEGVQAIPVVPGIHRHAAQGHGAQATAMALRRLRASGYRPAVGRLEVQGDNAKRTAAALLFPISDQALLAILRQTTRPEKKPA